jgi:hypothetical protein
MSDVSQLGTLIKEWMSLEEDIRTLGAEVREKRRHVKATRAMISSIMRGAKVGQLNISAGQVQHRVTTKKQAMSKKYIVGALTMFFNGDETMAAKCAKFLEDNRPLKEVESLKLEPSAAGGGGPMSP